MTYATKRGERTLVNRISSRPHLSRFHKTSSNANRNADDTSSAQGLCTSAALGAPRVLEQISEESIKLVRAIDAERPIPGCENRLPF